MVSAGNNICLEDTSASGSRSALRPILKLPGDQLFCIEDLLIGLLNWHDLLGVVKLNANVQEWHDTDALVSYYNM